MDVIGGTHISNEIISLVEGAKTALYLISPYFDPWDRLGVEIGRAAKRCQRVVLVVRGGEDRAKQEAKAQPFVAQGVEVLYLHRLHAKIYLTESQAIVTSMNLLRSSALDSFEIALRLRMPQDSEAILKVAQEVKQLVERAREETSAVDGERAAKKAATEAGALASLLETTGGRKGAVASPAAAVVREVVKVLAAAQALSSTGHCIRCNESVAFDDGKPLCPQCFRSWSKFSNPEYTEKYCHRCGKERSTSVAKPLCKPCWGAMAG